MDQATASPLKSASSPSQPHPHSKKISVHLDHDRLMDCIHCGLCLPTCPTYAENGLEADSPRGRIYQMRALAEGRVEATPALVEHLDKCLGCRACETACPSGVQYGHLIEGARAHLHEHYQRPLGQRLKNKLVELSFPYPNRMELALLPVRVLRRTGVLPLMHKIGIMKLLGPLGDMEALLPELPPMQKRLKFPVRWLARGEKQASVGMITGCVMQVMQSPVNEATARVLCKAGCDVAAPKTQNCCGALHAHIGDIDQAKIFAQQNIIAFETWQKDNGVLDAIIINAAGCGAALKEYPGWFKGDEEWEPRARSFSAQVMDVSEFLAQPNYKTRLESLMSADPHGNDSGHSHIMMDGHCGCGHDAHEEHEPISMTYHDACHLAHGQGVRSQPRDLMSMCAHHAGMQFVALGESEMCCGSAGSYNITQPHMAMQLLERKMKHIAQTGAEVVVTGNPGCAMQIMLGAKKFDTPVEVLHPVQVLDLMTE